MFGQYSEASGRDWREAREATARGEASEGRIRRTFDSPDRVAHLWAHQTQDSAKFRDNFYFTGASLFSYGSHFLVGFVMPDGAGSRDIVLLNADSHSVTTSRHQRIASGATRHMESYCLPSLTDIRADLAELAAVSLRNTNSRLIGSRDFAKLAARDLTGLDYYGADHSAIQSSLSAANVHLHLRKWAKDNQAEIDASESAKAGALWLFTLAGLKPADLGRELLAAWKAEKQSAELRAKGEMERKERDAKQFAAMSDSEFAALYPRDGTGDYYAKERDRFAKNLWRLAKLAKAKGWKAIARTLKAREKQYREFAAGTDGRLLAARRSAEARELRAWRNGMGKRPGAWTFSAERFPAIHRRLVLAESQEREAERRLAFDAWQIGGKARPSLNSWEKQSPEFAAISASVEAERDSFVTAFDNWQLGAAPRPAVLSNDCWTNDYVNRANWNRMIGAVQSDQSREAREKREAETRAREAERFAKLADIRRAWLAGESDARGQGLSDELGGALIRATGVERDASGEIKAGELETSHGAAVPLVHAIKAFRFVRLVRERGETWQRNGRTIRVGHYQIDAIDSGGFTAGCHRINWQEIARLAGELGVLNLPADDSAVVTSH